MFKKNVITYFGSLKNVAETLSISTAAVSQWGKIIPEKNAYKLQAITNGDLKVDVRLYEKNKS